MAEELADAIRKFDLSDKELEGTDLGVVEIDKIGRASCRERV